MEMAEQAATAAAERSAMARRPPRIFSVGRRHGDDARERLPYAEAFGPPCPAEDEAVRVESQHVRIGGFHLCVDFRWRELDRA